ncbi:hypothetical protein SAY87_010228 [Trapa incisa]|uniref:RIN4 pathogenic type III effector avirulence factor Avr cleavage site domain-containing protein n=1 Tax=Trapa incisa TaxID=236973 RepID=A0AAN7JAQ6_9MYRT|nr:hypothetical protein SAY87_010228 [Trapa incisa]
MQTRNYCRKREIPAFGSWDCNDGGALPFTQCFDAAASRHHHPDAAPTAGLLRYSFSHHRDLYASEVVAPSMIVVPPRRLPRAKARVEDNASDVKGEEEAKGKSGGVKWVGGGDHFEVEEGPLNPNPSSAFVKQRPTPKPVDEDLYKIPPDLLIVKPKKKRGLLMMMIFFSCCSLPPTPAS